MRFRLRETTLQPPANLTPSTGGVVVRFAGDSGDGIQLSGMRLTMAAALGGKGVSTLPDFPAEIRAPAGTTYGVSAFQLRVGEGEVLTPGDTPDVLVAFNPASLKTNLSDLDRNGLLVVDSGTFTARSLKKAGYDDNPLEADTLNGVRTLAPDISRHTIDAVKEFELGQKGSLRCRNMWAVGLTLWLLDRDTSEAEHWIRNRFGDTPVGNANLAALKAGHAYGETTEVPGLDLLQTRETPHDWAPGEYRTITGAEALAFGLAAAAERTGLDIVFCAYPITPASTLLHQLSAMRRRNVLTFQAEDEIGAACAAIGASYGGALGVTSSSGPGISLKAEALGLAVAVELPLVVVNSQRAGPSTGMPTKTEQADLLQALYGRHGEAPLVVLAPRSPSDCYTTAIEAAGIAVRHMTPVMILSDAFIASTSEPWRLPEPVIPGAEAAEFRTDPEHYEPFARDPDTLARAWVKPGTPGLEHRIGGLEKSAGSGGISYDPDNHQVMNDARIAKVARVACALPPAAADGPEDASLCVVTWGSTFGVAREALAHCRATGTVAAHIHLRHLHPLPANLGDLLASYWKVLVPEVNSGQLVRVLRDRFLVDAESLPKVTGKPFRVDELVGAIESRAKTVS